MRGDVKEGAEVGLHISVGADLTGVKVEGNCSLLLGVVELRVQTFCSGETRALPW